MLAAPSRNDTSLNNLLMESIDALTLENRRCMALLVTLMEE